MLMMQPGGDVRSKLWLQAGLRTRLQPRLDLDQIPVNVPVLMPKLGFNPCKKGARNLFAHLYKYEGSNAKWVVITTAYEYKSIAAANFGIKLTIWCSWRCTWGGSGYGGS